MRIPRGSQLMLTSILVASLVNLGIKRLRHVPIAEVVFFMSLVSLLTSVVALRCRKLSVWGQHRGLLLTRGVSGALGIVLHFFALQHLLLPSAVAFRRMAPIFSALLGIFVVKEPVRWQQWFFFALSFAGVVLVNGLAFTGASWYMLAGFMGALFSGLSNNFVRKIGSQEHPLVVSFYSDMVATLLSGAYLLYDFVALQGQDILLLGAISVLSLLAHYYTVKAYQHGPVATVSATAYVSVAYAWLINQLYLREVLPLLQLLGLALIIIGTLLNLFYKQKRS